MHQVDDSTPRLHAVVSTGARCCLLPSYFEAAVIHTTYFQDIIPHIHGLGNTEAALVYPSHRPLVNLELGTSPVLSVPALHFHPCTFYRSTFSADVTSQQGTTNLEFYPLEVPPSTPCGALQVVGSRQGCTTLSCRMDSVQSIHLTPPAKSTCSRPGMFATSASTRVLNSRNDHGLYTHHQAGRGGEGCRTCSAHH